MAFLDPHVLTSFLRGYLEYREKHWSKKISKLQSYVRDDKKIKTDLCDELNKVFYNGDKFNSLEKCLKLIDDLGIEGRKPNSVLAEVQQAIKSYIVASILDSECKEEFLEIRKNLREVVDKQQKEIEEEYLSDTSVKYLDENIKIYYTNLLKLADLGDMKAVGQAHWRGLFMGLRKPSDVEELSTIHTVNKKIPFCYQEKFHEIFYDSFIRPKPKWQVDFQTFVEISGKLSSEVIEVPPIVEIKEISEYQRNDPSLFDKMYYFFSKKKDFDIKENQIDNKDNFKQLPPTPIFQKK